MQSNKEIFKFVQMRQVPRLGKTTKPNVHPEVDVPGKLLDYVSPHITGLLDDMIKDPESGHRAARRSLDTVRDEAKTLLLFVKGAQAVRQKPAFNVEQFRKGTRAILKRANISRDRLEHLLRISQEGFAALHILGNTDSTLIETAKDAIRGIEIAKSTYQSKVAADEVRALSQAQISVNGYPRTENKSAKPITSQNARINRNLFGNQPAVKSKLIPYKGGLLQTKTSAQTAIAVTGGKGVPDTVGEPRKVTVGDLILVEETGFTYEMAEIAHVENVMQSESRHRFHSLRTASEETSADETELTETSTTELKTTEQFELQEAISSASNSQSSMGASASVSAGYGPVSVSASGSVDESQSQQSAYNRATRYAKETIETATKEVVKRVKTLRTSRSSVIVTEKNKHSFQNTYGQGHVVGIYRYLNKRLFTQTINYGGRLMLEFIVPEPAANYINAVSQSTPDNLVIEEPVEFTLLPSDINESNYQEHMAAYNVPGLPVPPVSKLRIPAEFEVPGPDTTSSYNIYKHDEDPDLQTPYKGYVVGTEKIEIPTGYAAKRIHVGVNFVNRTNDQDDPTKSERVRITANQSSRTIANVGDGSKLLDVVSPLNFEGDVSVAWSASVRFGAAVVMSVECERRDSGFEEWQNLVWTEINNAYQAEKSAFDNAVAYAQSAGTTYENSPATNRIIETAELKRSAISMLTEQDFSLFGTVPTDEPQYFDPDEAAEEGEYIRFFEDAFEWANMAHQYYEYFWAGQHRWTTLLGYSSVDFEHEQFLKAGAARVIIPVTPGHEVAVLTFLENGKIWNGEDDLKLDRNHSLYSAISAMLEEPRDLDETLVSKDEIVVPTNLVILQEGAHPNETEFVTEITTPPIVELAEDDTEDLT